MRPAAAWSLFGVVGVGGSGRCTGRLCWGSMWATLCVFFLFAWMLFFGSGIFCCSGCDRSFQLNWLTCRGKASYGKPSHRLFLIESSTSGGGGVGCPPGSGHLPARRQNGQSGKQCPASRQDKGHPTNSRSAHRGRMVSRHRLLKTPTPWVCPATGGSGVAEGASRGLPKTTGRRRWSRWAWTGPTCCASTTWRSGQPRAGRPVRCSGFFLDAAPVAHGPVACIWVADHMAPAQGKFLRHRRRRRKS